MKILIINGPNLNMLGIREPDKYGTDSAKDLENLISEYIKEHDTDIYYYQSNHEGDLIDKIQEAYFNKYDGIVINPGGYTHTSIAILDAINAVKIPTVEVHVSDVMNREEFRKTSYIRQACITSVIGHGVKGYIEAIDYLVNYINVSNDKEE